MKVGLTGGLACGKSFVGRIFEAQGARIVRADDVGHEVLLPGGEACDSVIEEFGRGIVDAEGRIDRAKLAALVFDNPERLAKLNAIVHPAVRRRVGAIEREILAGDPHAIVVVEAAILIEAGSYKNYDVIVLVTCREEQQIDRAVARGAAPADVQARIDRQMPAEAKRKYAHYVIDTSGTEEETSRLADAVWRELTKLEKMNV